MDGMMINHGIHGVHGKVLLAVAALGVSLAVLAADPAITVSAKQRYPWNGLVDLQFTITGTSGTKYDTSFTAKDMVGGTNIAMRTIRKSNGVAANATKEQLLPGNYKWVWDAAADLPKNWNCARMTVIGTTDYISYSVKFNANGGTGTMSNESFTYGTAKALTANAFKRTGYTFQGWATSASGSKVYNDKQSVSNLTTTSGAVVNLYAKWSGISYSVKFNANGGTGTMANESFTYGTSKALTANAFTRTSYTFQGWSTSASGSKVYNNKQTVSNLTTTAGAVVNFYAVWDHSKVQLWAGGPYWAETNIGAENSYDYGYYFWWGDTVGYKRVNNKWVASDGSSSNFSFCASNAPTYGKTFSKLYTDGWTTTYSGSAKLVTKHDAAKAHWGGSWRMPTSSDVKGFTEKCTSELTTLNGVKGQIIRGKGNYANKSIFFPYTGYGSRASLVNADTDLEYWLSNPSEGGNYGDYGTESAYSWRGSTYYNNYRYYGRPVRPVQSP